MKENTAVAIFFALFGILILFQFISWISQGVYYIRQAFF